MKYKIEMKPANVIGALHVTGKLIRSSKAEFNNMLIANITVTKDDNICYGELDLIVPDQPLQFMTYHKAHTDCNKVPLKAKKINLIKTYDGVQFREFKKLFTKLELMK
tara:strand:+ start:130 stop:453 length:324 start_codon:yes stop_codon:yes gene_type:complete